MRTASFVIGPSPLDSDFVRLQIAVTADRRKLALDYWIDLPADLAPRTAPGNALAVLLLPLACNCSTCQKCLRTMATLDLVGAAARARTFDWSEYSLDRVAAAWLPTESEQAFFSQIARAARARGRLDVAESAEAAIATSRRRTRQRELRNAAQRLLVRTLKSNPVTRPAWNGLKALRARGRPLAVGKRPA